MSTSSNHGGARPGAGRKPKTATTPKSTNELLSALIADPAALGQIQ